MLVTWQAARRPRERVWLALPGLVAAGVGAGQLLGAWHAPHAPAPVDPRAAQWLAESDEAMNRLSGVRVRLVSPGPDESAVLTTILFQAPDSFHVQLSNGPETVVDGAAYYTRLDPEARWHAMMLSQPFVFPAFAHSRQLASARLDGAETIDGRPAQRVAYTLRERGREVAYVRWIDIETRWILRESMAPIAAPGEAEGGHRMLSLYEGHDSPAMILTPPPAEVGPLPTPAPVSIP
jgi:hypothetical protein